MTEESSSKATISALSGRGVGGFLNLLFPEFRPPEFLAAPLVFLVAGVDAFVVEL